MSYEEIECPYCEHAYDLCHDDGAFYNNEDDPEEEECPKCDKHFLVHSSMRWDFEAEKAECLNDGNHSWKKRYSETSIKNYPELAKKENCETCRRQRTIA